MYSEDCEILNTTFKISCESMYIYASQGSLKNMLQVGLKWLNQFSISELMKMMTVKEQQSFISAHVSYKYLATLNETLDHPIEALKIDIDLLTKRITLQFYMQG